MSHSRSPERSPRMYCPAVNAIIATCEKKPDSSATPIMTRKEPEDAVAQPLVIMRCQRPKVLDVPVAVSRLPTARNDEDMERNTGGLRQLRRSRSVSSRRSRNCKGRLQLRPECSWQPKMNAADQKSKAAGPASPRRSEPEGAARAAREDGKERCSVRAPL